MPVERTDTRQCLGTTLDQQDLEALLAMDPRNWLRHIIMLNNTPRYHMGINAIVVMAYLQDRLSDHLRSSLRH